MRFLILMITGLLVQISVAYSAMVIESDETLQLNQYQLTLPLNAELVKTVKDQPVRTHLLVKGSLEKVNHVLQPEDSSIIRASKSAWTYELHDALRTGTVGDLYRTQLADIGTIVFECSGRSCGSSSYWANKVFKESVLYGPEQFQRYFIAELSQELSQELSPERSPKQSAQAISGVDDPDYIVVYVAQRATRDIYLYIQFYSR